MSGGEPTDSLSQARKRKTRDDEDSIAILKAVIEFRSNNRGVAPTPTTMRPVFDAVKGTLHRELTVDQLYNRFRTLRHKYYKGRDSGPGSTPYEIDFFNLSAKAWGDYFKSNNTSGNNTGRKKSKPTKPSNEEETATELQKKPKIDENNRDGDDDDDDVDVDNKEQEEEEEDNEEEDEEEDNEEEENVTAGNSFKHLTEQMTTYWKEQGLPMVTLELGLKHMEKAKAAVLEDNWWNYLMTELKIKAKSAELSGNMVFALVGE